MFADDTKIYRTITPDTNDSQLLQDDLDQIQQWAKDMCMQFHPEKCKVMHLGHNNPQATYHMTKPQGDVHTLQATDEEKDLGVLIDRKLIVPELGGFYLCWRAQKVLYVFLM
jgi:hypothetical protein